uniref:SJCHGC09815 protein n=1 Tax=Schistosoma japonicum TaxID=6182 RepID=Q5BQT6_SCHJA|nr:SJCHGC09815 protein [Schistosoma japonicum]
MSVNEEASILHNNQLRLRLYAKHKLRKKGKWYCTSRNDTFRYEVLSNQVANSRPVKWLKHLSNMLYFLLPRHTMLACLRGS